MRAATTIAVLAAAAGLTAGLARPAPAKAAGCNPAQVSFGFGDLVVAGNNDPANSCDELLRVWCSAGLVEVTYAEPPGGTPSVSSPGASCAMVSSIEAYGFAGADRIDLTAVTPANGFGGSPTILADGGNGTDTILGSGFGDLLTQGADGSAGTINGFSGADRIVGDSGRDRIRGGAGGDVLLGLEGADSERGDSGPDRVAGGDGRDLIDGGGGDDRLFGDAGSDTLRGRRGDDLLVGGLARDRLLGGPGRNRLVQ